jgi:hypothetical protein
MHKGIAIAAAALLINCGRKAGTVDTTKDVYEDSEAPKEQIYEVNGVATTIPWEKVPPKDRWEIDYAPGGKGFKSRVPIIKIMVLSWDKDGHPVPPENGYRVETTHETLNPKYWRHILYDKGH